ncbi:tail fiber domain-containing protein [Salmonella enterica]|nr:tail fiber domain-containing protein [Salmonella enterica]
MPPIDEKTTRLDLPKPAQPNTLKNDVERLRQSLDILDDKVATLDPATGKLTDNQIPDDVARLDPAARNTIPPAQLPPEVPQMEINANGDRKIKRIDLPDEAVTNIHVAASEVLMLDLDASIGDVVKVSGSGKTYELIDLPVTDRSNWKELVTNAVTSVNGYTGDVIVANVRTNPYADVTNDPMARSKGPNNNITELQALSGPLKLGGDGVDDFEAVTVRQLKGAMGTSGGASMTGVMNNFIGAVEWFAGYSRTALPAGYIAADGQELDRADYPDLFEAVKKGMFGSVLETDWLLQPTQRGKYSYGTGGNAQTGTKFRVPDLNGMFTPTNTTGGLASIGSVYLRGSKSTEPAGLIKENGAPNIIGGWADRLMNGGQDIYPQPGAIYSNGKSGTTPLTETQTTGKSSIPNLISFNASRSSPAYGREGTTEVRPNTVYGIWIIRATGAFNAADTKFNIINASKTLPAAGQSISGGEVVCDYQAAGDTEGRASLRMAGTVGAAYSARINVFNKTRNQQANFDMSDDGAMNIPGTLTAGGANITGAANLRDVRGIWMNGGAIQGKLPSINVFNQGGYDNSKPPQGRGSQIVLRYGPRQDSSSRVEIYPLDYQGNYFCAKLYALKDSGGHQWEFRQNDGSLHGDAPYQPASDNRIKSELKPVENPLAAVLNWRGVTYKRDDVDAREVGLIAQDVEPWAPEAVTIRPRTSFDQKTTIEDCRGLNYMGLNGAYHTEAIKSLFSLVELALDDPDAARAEIARIKAVKPNA